MARTSTRRTRISLDEFPPLVVRHVCPTCESTDTRPVTDWTARCANGHSFSPATARTVTVG